MKNFFVICFVAALIGCSPTPTQNVQLEASTNVVATVSTNKEPWLTPEEKAILLEFVVEVAATVVEVMLEVE